MHSTVHQPVVNLKTIKVWIRKWRASLNELRPLAGGHYPPFVYASAPIQLPGTTVPVFMFHTIRAATFDAQLRYLAENGYHTPTLDDFFRFLTEQKALPPSSVLLTFDDVERGLLTVGIPLLRKYGLRCVAFLVPGRIEFAGGTHRPGTDKVWPSWSDVWRMRDSGVVDFGSHTLNHARIFVGDRVSGFVHPDAFVDGLLLDNPLVRQNGRDFFLEELGAPLFATDSRLGSRRRFFDNEAMRKEITRFVKEQGGPAFFNHTDWQDRLAAHWHSLAVEPVTHGCWETVDEQHDAIRREMTESRAMLEERLKCPVRDLAYPWATGSDLAVKLSRTAGYRTNFWGPLRDVRINRPGQNPFRVARIKEDYLFRLPGTGRASLLNILRIKARRRRSRHDIY